MMNTKWLWVIVAVLVGAILFVAFNRFGDSDKTLRGEVIRVDTENFTITMKGLSEASIKTVIISSNTVIEKTIFDNPLDGEENNFSTREINVRDVKEGERMIVTYKAEREGSLSGVSKVAIAGRGSVDTFIEATTFTEIFLKTKITEVDSTMRIISFSPYERGGLSTKIAKITLPEGTLIRSVSSEDRLPFAHAYSDASFTDIAPEKTLFMSASSGIGPSGEFVPNTFVLLETR